MRLKKKEFNVLINIPYKNVLVINIIKKSECVW